MKESQLRLADVRVTTIDMNQLRRQLVKCISYIQVAAQRGANPAVPKAELDQMLVAARAELGSITQAANPVGNVRVESIEATPATMNLSAGTPTGQITVAFTPANATNKGLTYSSSTPAAATVNSTGLVTRVAAGSTTITVTSADGSKTDTVAVTVA